MLLLALGLGTALYSVAACVCCMTAMVLASLGSRWGKLPCQLLAALGIPLGLIAASLLYSMVSEFNSLKTRRWRM